MTSKSVNFLKFLVESTVENLRSAGMLKDEYRKRALRLAFEDLGRAQGLWQAGRLPAMPHVQPVIAAVRVMLVEALDRNTKPLARADMITHAHKKLLPAMHAIKALAPCQEEVETA